MLIFYFIYIFENNNVIIVIANVIVGCYIMSKNRNKENFIGKVKSITALTNIKDMNANCKSWASNNECQKNPLYMYQYCPRACSVKNMENYCKSSNYLAKRYKDNKYCDRILDNPCKNMFAITKNNCIGGVLFKKHNDKYYDYCVRWHSSYGNCRNGSSACIKPCVTEASTKTKKWKGHYDYCVNWHKSYGSCRNNSNACSKPCLTEATIKTKRLFR